MSSLDNATVRNLHSGRWTTAGCPLGLDFSDNIHALDHLPEDDVLRVLAHALSVRPVNRLNLFSTFVSILLLTVNYTLHIPTHDIVLIV